MHLGPTIKQHIELANHLAKGDKEKAEIIKTFYDEYFAVMDLPAEFYIETVRDVFQEHLLPQGKMTYHGRPVNPASIKRMGLMTVEGEKDDICSIGQTVSPTHLSTGVRAYRKVHHMQAGVGHYGVFSRKRWNNQNYPPLRGFVQVKSGRPSIPDVETHILWRAEKQDEWKAKRPSESSTSHHLSGSC